MTDAEFDKDLKEYVACFVSPEKGIVRTDFHFRIQPGLILFEMHLDSTENEPMSADLRKRRKYLSSILVEKVESYHRRTTNNGLNKWNRASFAIDSDGQVTRKFIWDEVWEQENIDSFNGQTELVRQKWYWEEI